MKQFLIGVALMIIGPLLKKASPIVRDKVHELVDNIVKAAAATKNKFDDQLAEALHFIVIGEPDDILDDE